MTGVLALDKIRIDGGTQMRVDLNEETVAEYAQTIRDGGDFPPVVVFFDGSKHWLADGFHRFHGYRNAGALEISADIRTGTKRDAILFSVGANASHGLRRTNADKRKAVETLLKDKEWAAWPQAKIAQACGVSREFVNRLSQVASCDRSQDGGRAVERNGSKYHQDTSNIGKGRPTTPSPAVSEAAARAEEQSERRARHAENAGKPSTPSPEPIDQFAAWVDLTEQTADLTADAIFAACPVRMRPTLSQRCEAVRAIIDQLDDLIENPPVRGGAA